MKLTQLSAVAIGGMTAAVLAAPIASGTPDVCTGPGVANTVSSVTGAAQQYLGSHPGAGQVISAAMNNPAQAEPAVRGYFTANPQEYYDLRGILAPIGDVQRQCNVTVLSPALQAAYSQFMAG